MYSDTRSFIYDINKFYKVHVKVLKVSSRFKQVSISNKLKHDVLNGNNK